LSSGPDHWYANTFKELEMSQRGGSSIPVSREDGDAANTRRSWSSGYSSHAFFVIFLSCKLFTFTLTFLWYGLSVADALSH